LLAADRDDLDTIVSRIVAQGDISLDSLCLSDPTGVPGPSSRLALLIGEPISSLPWTQTGTHTIRIANVNKPKKGEPFIFHHGTCSTFACPDPRSHPGAYVHSLDAFVNHVEDILDTGKSIVLRPGVAPATGVLVSGSTTSTDIPPDIDSRRTIIPLALVLLLSIPDLGGNAKLDGLVHKGNIADVLHQLVAMWPDGNPPRAALKRVNEYLMSKR
jgi:tRNA A64-2'-O-ribosylphosphate transferase